ncbi:MAG: GTPase HflX [bacterium]|nr:GTPase HflX [bacterium]
MTQEITGNTKGLASSQNKLIQKLFRRRINNSEIVTFDLAQEMLETAENVGRQVGVLLTREGKVSEVIVGTKEILYLPDLGRYRLAQGRLRRLRLITTDLSTSKELVKIKSDIYTDLEKLRLDAVVSVKKCSNRIEMAYAHIMPPREKESFGSAGSHTEVVSDLSRLDFDFAEFIEELESELATYTEKTHKTGKPNAVLVGVYDKGASDSESSMLELRELAKTAGVNILDSLMQKRTPDPKTLLGKGKLEEVILHCLKVGADIIIFDCELKPGQWRAITNSTELKVLDRSMLILDIFAQRANSSEGRLQVELAQLKYNLPRLVELDAGLSRLSGGIGGRGPGETKLELGRRQIRDKISLLEDKIDKISQQRDLRRKQRIDNKIPVVAILGYTNVGKSTLFNKLTASNVFVENKLFATLDPAHRRLRLPSKDNLTKNETVILTDTVGFIRHLPEELMTAFKATLDEIKEASVLIHVLDASDPEIAERKKAVDEILLEMQLSNVDQLIILNKSDKISQEKIDNLTTDFDAIAVSAITGIGLKELVIAIAKELDKIGKKLEKARKDSHAQF